MSTGLHYKGGPTVSRSFTAQNLIQLPRLSAAEAVVLVTQLLTTAEAQAKAAKLPPAIQRSP